MGGKLEVAWKEAIKLRIKENDRFDRIKSWYYWNFQYVNCSFQINKGRFLYGSDIWWRKWLEKLKRIIARS